MKVKSNAKINLGLKIIGKKDGYHLLESKFIPISIYDILSIKKNDSDKVTGMIISNEENIIYKAIKLYKQKFDVKECISVNIKKRIPMQAGLGGGSSNAAFTLIAMNKLLNLNVSDDELKELALELGSDCAFFIDNVPSYVEGRGEMISPLVDFEKIYGILIFDDMCFGTKDVYTTYDYIENKETDLINDLELAARILDKDNRIISIEKALKETGSVVESLTGSGGAIFGLYENKKDAMKALKQLKHKYTYVSYFESI